ncbi:MAG: S8 family serine peptidase, partial [Thermoanaerobaculia bacterium]|nr:S8 family serine peptidase [Thermoanaerobaculia bacterium]
LAHDGTEADFYAGVDWLVAQGVDVISYSCGWTAGFPHDGAGLPYNPVNAKVEQARAAGVLFVTSAGNSGDGDHYHAPYASFSGTAWHSFDGDWANGVYMVAGNSYYSVLVWNDWPVDPTTSGSSHDYLLELWRWNGTDWIVVAVSDNPQSGAPGELPVEEIEYTAAVSDWFYLTISRVDGESADFLVLDKSARGALQHWVAASSLGSPADSDAATTVGAVHWNGWGAEPFSSRGPTLGPRGEPTGGALKPDLAAADAVSTVTYGVSDGAAWPSGTGFFGTSAACPQVAGAAALLASAYTSFDADALETRLVAQAIDQGDSGPDTTFGHGLLFLADQFLFVDAFESGNLGTWDGAAGGK